MRTNDSSKSSVIVCPCPLAVDEQSTTGNIPCHTLKCNIDKWASGRKHREFRSFGGIRRCRIGIVDRIGLCVPGLVNVYNYPHLYSKDYIRLLNHNRLACQWWHHISRCTTVLMQTKLLSYAAVTFFSGHNSQWLSPLVRDIGIVDSIGLCVPGSSGGSHSGRIWPQNVLLTLGSDPSL